MDHPRALAVLILLLAPASVRAGPPDVPNFLLDDWMYRLRVETRSHSAGRANRGRVVNSEELELTGRTWRVIHSARGRNTNHGHEALVGLLRHAADAVALKHPGTITEVGNIGLPGGGKIVQSKSHQAGRDVDVALFARDRRGRPAVAGRFLEFDGSGRARGGWTLDLERTWDFVGALLTSEDPVVQWIFVSAPVRELLLQHARKAGAPQALLRRASEALRQPTDSTAHADHMHIRIYCSAWDRANGCLDYGPLRANGVQHDPVYVERMEQLARRARKGLIGERLAALELLAGIYDPRLDGLFQEMLCDAEPRVQVLAVRWLGTTGDPETARVLVPLLDSPHKAVRAAVLDSLRLLLDEPRLPEMRAEEAWRELSARARSRGTAQTPAPGRLPPLPD